jgi:chloramphenicol 3-O-phosphotransferase
MVLDFDSSGLVHVTCPWKAEHSSDSGTSETSWLPAGVGGIERGNFKCLHAHCAHRGADDFLAAVGYTDTQFDVVVQIEEPGKVADEPWPVFARDKAGRIESTATNAQLALRRPDITGFRLGYDEFMGRRVIAQHGDTQWRPFKDSDYFEIRVQLERVGFLKPGQDLVREAVRCVSEHESFDSAALWGNGLQWDGVPRVERFFERYMGVVDTGYHRAVGLYLWTALAGRCMDPGCKVDMVPVLIGAQGSGKTSMVEALAPTDEAFIEVNLDQRNEDQMARALRGKLVGELAELRGLAGREAEDIKAWISRRHEEIRALYAEFHTKYARRLVMIGTGNNPEFLSDETGERRWLPLRVGATDLEALRADRDQLWAEGVSLWREGGVQWREAQALAVEHHADFKVRDPWEEAVEHWLAEEDLVGLTNGEQIFSARDVLVYALKIADSAIKKSDEMRVAKVLRMLGFQRDVRWEGGKSRKVWERVGSCVKGIA